MIFVVGASLRNVTGNQATAAGFEAAALTIANEELFVRIGWLREIYRHRCDHLGFFYPPFVSADG